MAELTTKTRFLPPLHDIRAPSPGGLSPRRAGHRRLHSLSDDAPYDVSPIAILQAFADNVFPQPETEEYKYLSCAKGATSAQKGLAIKAAKVAIGARDWYLELKRWNWPGSFGEPSAEGGKETVEFKSNEGSLQRVPLDYWGCLPAAVVEAYEARVEEILREMHELDIDELKLYVLDIHGSRSRPNSSYERRARATLNLMDDVSLLVTGTMVQALPVLTLLNQLLDTWSVRLAILKETPKFLADLDQSKRAMQLAWDAIKLPKEEELYNSTLKQWKNAVDTISGVIEEKAASLGQRLDGFLDSLEGREDVLPDVWIDDFEGMEADFGRWTGESRKRRMQLDWTWANNPKADPIPDPVETPAQPVATEAKRTLPVVENEIDTRSATPDVESFPSPPNFSPRDIQSALPQSPVRDPSRIGLAAPFTPRAAQKEVIRSSDSEPEDENRKPILNEESDAEVEPFERTPRARISVNMSPESGWKRSGLIFNDSSFDDFNEVQDEGTVKEKRPAILKRASTTSIESFTRDQLKSITLSRQNSTSSITSGRRKRFSSHDSEKSLNAAVAETSLSPSASRGSIALPPFQEEDSSPAVGNYGMLQQRPKTPESDPQRAPTSSPPSTPTRSPDSGFGDDSPSVRPARLNPLRAHPPLNVSVKKLRRPENSIDAKSTSESPITPATPPSFILSENENAGNVQHSKSPKKSRHVRTYSSTSNAELNRQISDILSTVPANIRLTNTESDSTSSTAPSKSPRSTSGRFSALGNAFRSSRSSVKSPEMTLSPVKNIDSVSIRKAASSEHSDIKLYHLIQPGRDKPIKLFIRRVGDNGERVMVRVGGGWADLAEYLRQYAEHHGRRTVSDGKFEVLGLNIDPNTGGASTISPSGTPSRDASRAPSRSVSPLPGATPFTASAPTQAGTPGSSTAHLASRLVSGSNVNTPDSVNSNTSRGSWREDNSSIGLAGPASKKLDLSEEKLEWIDNMMSQARRISGGKKDGRDLGRDSRQEGVSDMGRVGGTRRVFLRGQGSGRESATGDRRENS